MNFVLSGKNATRQMLVTARYSDGIERDVTRLCKFQSNDDSIAKISAEGIVSGERGLGDRADAIADAVASLMINRLEAAGVGGHARVAHLRWNDPDRRPRVEQLYGRELLDALIRRTDKHLAHAAMLALTRADP